MPIAYNLAKAAEYMLRDGHLAAIGDSHSTDAQYYLWGYQWPIISQINFAGMVVSAGNTSAQVHSRGLFNGTNADFARYSEGATPNNADTGANDTTQAYTNVVGENGADGTVIRQAPNFRGLRNVADGTSLGNGILINKRNGNTPADYPWPLINGGRPWYHGKSLRCRAVLVTGTGATFPSVSGIGVFMRRIGTSSNTVSATVSTSFGTDLLIDATDDTASLVDFGTYDSTGNTVTNDHQVQVVLTTAAGVDETNAGVVPLCAPVWSVDGSGNALRGCYFDNVGRAGMDAAEWNTGSGDGVQWTEYFRHTVVHPDRKVCIWLMLSNMAVTHYSGSQVTAAFTTDQENAMARLIASAISAGSSAQNIAPVIVMAWKAPPSASSPWTDQALCESANNALYALAKRHGWGFFSFYEAFGRGAPWTTADIHATTDADGRKLANAVLSTLQQSAGESGAFGGRGRNFRSRRRAT